MGDPPERPLDFEIQADVGVRDGQARCQQADRGVKRLGNKLIVERGLPQRLEGIVSGEEFVTSITTQGHRDMAAGEAAE